MRITGRTRLAGIMGWPVAHSRSPALHNFWIEEHGIDGAYVPLPVRPEQLAEALRALPVLGFRGCNLTLPHKQTALSIVDRVEPLARRIGAMNTVIVMADGSLEGRNTDVFGFRENLRERAPDWTPTAGPAVVVDIVYVPLETALLATARQRGHRVVDGLGMLLHQGRPGFEAWFGSPVEVNRELRAAVLTTLTASR